jgi:hypothetical protein
VCNERDIYIQRQRQNDNPDDTADKRRKVVSFT